MSWCVGGNGRDCSAPVKWVVQDAGVADTLENQEFTCGNHLSSLVAEMCTDSDTHVLVQQYPPRMASPLSGS